MLFICLGNNMQAPNKSNQVALRAGKGPYSDVIRKIEPMDTSTDIYIGLTMAIPFMNYLIAGILLKGAMENNGFFCSPHDHYNNYISCKSSIKSAEDLEVKEELIKASKYYFYSLIFVIIYFTAAISFMIIHN